MKTLLTLLILRVLFFCCLAEPPQKLSILSFRGTTPREWKSGEQPATLRPQATHLNLDLTFRREDRQITLTRIQPMDLGALTSFRLRSSIQQPENLLEGSIAFKSGSGWYIHSFTLHDPGSSHLLFNKSGFTTEGNPAGWNRVEAIRFSFWPRKTGTTQLQLYSLEGFVDRLWVLDPESLATHGDETYTSRVSVRHTDRLFKGLGLPHAVITPAEVTQSKERPSLIIIPYLPQLPSPLYQRLGQWMDQGTRVIVFESSHQGFAAKVGVELGKEIRSSTVGHFDHWTSTPDDFPSRIYQHAWSFRQIRPRGNSKATATWNDALGRNTGLIACIESDRGVWVNVAWRSGDQDAKQKALSEWIGRLAPELLAESLLYYQETKSPEQFEVRYGSLPAKGGASAHLKSMAEKAYSLALRVNASKLKTLRIFQESDQLMQRAFASGQPAWDSEIKGIWDQNGTGFYAGSWDQTCKELKQAGFNAVFPNMASAGRAHYPSKLIPPSKSLEKYGDQLKAFTTAAHKYGLQAHAWKICWKLNTRLPAFQEKLRRDGRLMQDAAGNEIPWLSISHPGNVQFEIDSLLEMARHAPLDGIHLDYMRYPGKEADYGPAARKAFEKRIGRSLRNWPGDVVNPGALKTEYQRFRQDELHSAMRQISAAVKKEFPKLKLTVAVWGAWPDCADAQGQDWPVWARNNWVDGLIPMNYTDNPDQFAGWIDLQRAQPGVADKLIPGIGLISSNAELNPAQVLQQLDIIKNRKLKGAVIYRLDSSLESRLFPYLKIWK